MDMIPFGQLQLMSPPSEDESKTPMDKGDIALAGKGVHRFCQLSDAQKRTFITLRAMAASPLMMGGDLPSLDAYSLALITNPDMLGCNQNGVMGELLFERDGVEVWRVFKKGQTHTGWVGVFNRSEKTQGLTVTPEMLGLNPGSSVQVRDVWNKRSFLLSEAQSQLIELEAHDVLFLSFHPAPVAKRPNVLFIAIDDLNDWVGAYGGHPQCKTPHIDTLAENAMIFRHASCPGPVCGPSRSALLSGFMPATTGIYGNSNNMLESKIVQTHATMPEYFSKHGYVTISRGKIFHKHTTQNGFDHGHWAFDVWEQAKGGSQVDPTQLNYRDKGIVNGKQLANAKYTQSGGSGFAFGPLLSEKEDTKDYKTAKWFEQKLQEDYDKPFFMAVGFSKPHLPFYAPQEYFDLYDLETVQVPE
ncbi:MAG: sulfatase-like hydrolase/transferase, partial [Planctomycetes bacterium]|nr:sulfatase-like hydrolase/transferase [Planctomycetota bacterium]